MVRLFYCTAVQSVVWCLNPNLTGWGATSFGGASSNVLLEVEVPVVTKETCTTAMADFAAINDGMICAGGVEGKDSCQVSISTITTKHQSYVKMSHRVTPVVP